MGSINKTQSFPSEGGVMFFRLSVHPAEILVVMVMPKSALNFRLPISPMHIT